MIEKINKNQLPTKGSFRGYLWYSDQVFPQLVWDEPISDELLTALPFVVEGQLFDAAQKVSIRIVHIDGQYRIAKMQLPNNYAEHIQHYYASKKFGHFSLKSPDNYDLQLWFYTHFSPVAKEAIVDFTVDQPRWTAFVGFSETLKKKQL